jgi:hypothetical protein
VLTLAKKEADDVATARTPHIALDGGQYDAETELKADKKTASPVREDTNEGAIANRK